jgi:HSP20 family protein
MRREPTVERRGMLDELDRIFDDWMKVLSLPRPLLLGRWLPDSVIHVDEFRDNGSLVIRAELPGLDPEKDVELTVADGVLTIDAERHEVTSVDDGDYLRRELRCGSFTRTLPLPAKITESDIKATYADGILEVRVPVPEPVPEMKIPIGKG